MCLRFVRHLRWLAPILVLPLLIPFASCERTDYSQMDTDYLLQSAAKKIATFSYFEAEPRLRHLRERLPAGSAEWQQSTYLLALALRHQTPSSAPLITESQALLQELLATSPDSSLAPDALMTLGRIAALRDYPGDVRDPEAAQAFYTQIIERYPQSDLRDLAFLRVQDLAMTDFTDPATVQAANDHLRSYIEENPQSPYLAALWEAIANSQLYLLENREAALAAFIEADRYSMVAPGRRGDRFWLIAQLAEETGDIPTARTYYQNLVEKSPRSLRRTEAQQRLATLPSSSTPSSTETDVDSSAGTTEAPHQP